MGYGIAGEMVARMASTREHRGEDSGASRSFWEKRHLTQVLKRDDLDLARQRKKKGI